MADLGHCVVNKGLQCVTTSVSLAWQKQRLHQMINIQHTLVPLLS